MVIVAVIALLAAGGTAVMLLRGGDDVVAQPDGKTDPSISVSPSDSSAEGPQLPSEPTPRPKPSKPGIEPPSGRGGLPPSWVKFAQGESTVRVDDLSRLGLTMAIPQDWACAVSEQYKNMISTTCTGTVGGKAVGGSVTVRTCAEPCDAKRKISLRKAEEAWGLRWIKIDDNTSYVQNSLVAGKPGWYVTMVRYWHSKTDGPLDRQVVVRMAAPPEQEVVLQKMITAVVAATP